MSTNSAVFDCAADTFERLSEIGYNGLDISFSALSGRGLFEMPEKEMEEYLLNMVKETKKYGLTVFQCHAPYQIPWVGDEKIVNATIKSIWAAHLFESPYIVVHPLMPFSMICENEEQAKESKRVNMEFFRMLIPYAEKYNVKIAIENLFPKGSAAASGEALLDYINTLNSPWITACLDTGHANLCGYDLVEMVKILGEKLTVVHIHDNCSNDYDEHYIPFVGNIDWKSFFGALKDVGYKGAFNLEDTNFAIRFPKELQTQAEQLAFNTLRWLINEYWK